jgi:hypothetical protein
LQGFARYSTDDRWHVPHFEKMLYDQAQLAVAYSSAYVATKHPLYADIVRDILTYVDRDLSDKVNFKQMCFVIRLAGHVECTRAEKCKEILGWTTGIKKNIWKTNHT